MRIAQVVASVESQAAGPSYTVPKLSEVLHQLGNDVELHLLGAAPRSAEFAVHVHEASSGLSRLGISRSMRQTIQQRASELDVIHSHGLWMFPNLYPAWAAKASKAQLVVSPRGMLDPPAMAISRHRKKVMWLTFQRRALERTDLFHATSEDEAAAIRKAGFDQPIAIIPNGVDIPQVEPVGRTRTVLYLGRLNQKKRIDRLIGAWSGLADRFPDWSLRIVGPDDDRRYVRILRHQASRVRNVEFSGPLYGIDKQLEYQRAAVVVLPTDSENFGMVVAEALAAGTPAIATKGAPWSGLVDHGCGWWVEPTVEGVESALADAVDAGMDVLDEMGKRGRSWMERDFGWEEIARQMAEAYRWLQLRGEVPRFVLSSSSR